MPVQTPFIPEHGVSYSAGIAYLLRPPGGKLQILLVLQKQPDVRPQKDGGQFLEQHAWKMPTGRFQPQRDRDPIDTAVREFREKTGCLLRRDALSYDLATHERIPSWRPSFDFHEAWHFLVFSENVPMRVGNWREREIKATGFFLFDELPGTRRRIEGAIFSPGHRKRLGGLIEQADAYLWHYDISARKLAALVAAPLMRAS